MSFRVYLEVKISFRFYELKEKTKFLWREIKDYNVKDYKVDDVKRGEGGSEK